MFVSVPAQYIHQYVHHLSALECPTGGKTAICHGAPITFRRDGVHSLHGDGLDLLGDRRAAHGAKAELRGARQATAVVPARDQRAVDGGIEAHLDVKPTLDPRRGVQSEVQVGMQSEAEWSREEVDAAREIPEVLKV